jgi:hypothetical protein
MAVNGAGEPHRVRFASSVSAEDFSIDSQLEELYQDEDADLIGEDVQRSETCWAGALPAAVSCLCKGLRVKLICVFIARLVWLVVFLLSSYYMLMLSVK